jgi:hypothetical protein
MNSATSGSNLVTASWVIVAFGEPISGEQTSAPVPNEADRVQQSGVLLSGSLLYTMLS